MPIPKSTKAQKRLVAQVYKKRPTRFPKGSQAAIAREIVAAKILKWSPHLGESQAYAISTAFLKGTLRRKEPAKNGKI